jgi:hypothetical protein
VFKALCGPFRNFVEKVVKNKLLQALFYVLFIILDFFQKILHKAGQSRIVMFFSSPKLDIA